MRQVEATAGMLRTPACPSGALQNRTSTNGFTVTYSDRRQDIYGLLVTNSGGVFLKAFLTERRNRAGNALRLDYFSYTAADSPVVRLKDIVDGDGQTNTITYVSSSSYS